jgi:phosphoribosyl 1,2-cyclic phosphodiesterase
MLECGIPYKQIQRHLDFKLSDISGVVISHEHKDHGKAAKDILRAGVEVYTSEGTASALGLSGHRLHRIKARHQFKVGTWTILPFDTQHDAKDPLGFLLASGSEKLLFATDTYYIRYRFNGLTHLMIECNHSADILQANVASGAVPQALKNRLIQSHFSLDNVKEFLRSNDLSRVREIHLLHLSDGNSDAVRFKREIQALTGKMVFIAGE